MAAFFSANVLYTVLSMHVKHFRVRATCNRTVQYLFA